MMFSKLMGGLFFIGKNNFKTRGIRQPIFYIKYGKNSARGAAHEEKRATINHPDQYRVNWGSYGTFSLETPARRVINTRLRKTEPSDLFSLQHYPTSMG